MFDKHGIWCICGRVILSEIGDCYVVTLDEERRWMRRRGDTVSCPFCRHIYGLSDLKNLVRTAPPSL